MEGLGEVAVPGRVVGQIQGVDLREHFVAKKLLRMVSRRTLVSVAAAALMMRDARLSLQAADAERIGIYVGDLGTIEDDFREISAAVERSMDERGEIDVRKFGTVASRALNPLMLLINIPNAPTAHISMQYDLRGPGNTFVTDFIAGVQAIGEAAETIRAGHAEWMVAGGLAFISPLSLLEFRSLGLRCEGDHDPAGAVAPFDRNTRGVAPAEGAAFLLLEDLEHAQARGASVYAEVIGYASSFEPSPDGIAPDPEGHAVLRALRAALERAGTAEAEVDCVVASGVGERAFDLAEGRALRRLSAGSPRLGITAITPLAGHLQGAMGAAQAAAACLSIASGVIPPIANHESPQPELAGLPFVAGQPARRPIRHALVSGVGLRGQAAALAFRALSEREWTH
jgi:3-oxoacyl-(acyl-carrier-protein) synthase